MPLTRRSLFAAAAAVLLATPVSAASPSKVNPDLAQAARAQGQAEALIVLADQATPTIAPLSADADYKQRRRALVQALRTRADRQQLGLRLWLESRGIAYRAYWITNMVQARLTPDELEALAARSEVARLETNPSIAARLPKPERDTPVESRSDATLAVEWGVTKIRAPEVWANGITGQGVVIGGADTGYRWAHPALQPHYRGWNGTSADHNHHWHDAIHVANSQCPANSPAPCDDDGHGTHTAGTFAGGDGGSNQIGVAPGAKWIGCRNMNAGNGTPATYIECMQWMMAPTDLAGNNPDPDLAPDIISNSWGCPASEGCTVGNELAQAVGHLTSAGILFVAAAGNDGPQCATIRDAPATYGTAFTVGATDINDRLASYSSRGPLTATRTKTRVYDGKVDLSAPGSNVRSAFSATGYASLSGTSMATPHVAGAAALVMSAAPWLKGQPEQVMALLRQTAQRTGIANTSTQANQVCVRWTAADWPNPMIGWGRLDAFAAYQAAVQTQPPRAQGGR
ncbi:MAG: S8 family serine peptidase [Rubrivivax sp.]|nr:S8 family serine peptidase [Rubrivivax sp.]